MAESKKGVLQLLAAAAMGGLGFVWLKVLLDAGYTSLQCLAGRYLTACIFMAFIYIAKPRKIEKNTVKKGVILGTVLFVFFYVMIEGLRLATPSVNAFLTNTQSVMVPLIAFVLFKRKPSKKVCIGAAMTVLGAWLLSFNGETDMSLGAALSLLSAVIFALQIVLLGDFVQECNAVDLVAVEDLTVLVLAALSSFLKGELLPAFEAENIISFAVLGFFCTFLYFVLQGIGQQKVSAGAAGIIITSESVFAAIFSFLLYGERMNAASVIGCAVILAAILAVECDFKALIRLTSLEK